MTRRQELRRHRYSIVEIRNILNSMKTLAYMETRKLSGFIESQRQVVEGMTQVAADFLSFYPDILAENVELEPVYLLIGSERGFCGDFNQAVMRRAELAVEAHLGTLPGFIVVGRKLGNILADDHRVLSIIDGASVVEEVSSVLEKIVHELSVLQVKRSLLAVSVISHYGANHNENGGDHRVETKLLLPPFQEYRHLTPRYSFPPRLNLTPKAFLLDLADQFLFAVLHEQLYTSLYEENHRRILHLVGAEKHLEHQLEALTRKLNTSRREEIIEEIEVILLNAINLDKSKPGS